MSRQTLAPPPPFAHMIFQQTHTILGKLQNARCTEPLLLPISSVISRHERPCARRAPILAASTAGLVEKLAKDVARALAAPDLREWLAKRGADPISMTQPEFARFVQSESESAVRIIKAAGISPQ